MVRFTRKDAATKVASLLAYRESPPDKILFGAKTVFRVISRLTRRRNRESSAYQLSPLQARRAFVSLRTVDNSKTHNGKCKQMFRHLKPAERRAITFRTENRQLSEPGRAYVRSGVGVSEGRALGTSSPPHHHAQFIKHVVEGGGGWEMDRYTGVLMEGGGTNLLSEGVSSLKRERRGEVTHWNASQAQNSDYQILGDNESTLNICNSKYKLSADGNRGDAMVRQLASHHGKTSSIPSGVTPGFPHVGIVPDDAAVRRVFSGISCFPRYCIPALLHTHLALPALALETSMFKSRPNLFTPLSFVGVCVEGAVGSRGARTSSSREAVRCGIAAENKLPWCGPDLAQRHPHQLPASATSRRLTAAWPPATLQGCVILWKHPRRYGGYHADHRDQGKEGLLAFHQGETRSLPIGVTQSFRVQNQRGHCRLPVGFLGVFPFPPALAFHRCPIFTSLTTILARPEETYCNRLGSLSTAIMATSDSFLGDYVRLSIPGRLLVKIILHVPNVSVTGILPDFSWCFCFPLSAFWASSHPIKIISTDTLMDCLFQVISKLGSCVVRTPAGVLPRRNTHATDAVGSSKTGEWLRCGRARRTSPQGVALREEEVAIGALPPGRVTYVAPARARAAVCVRVSVARAFSVELPTSLPRAHKSVFAGDKNSAGGDGIAASDDATFAP
ncbi:hypothetical protein PR048_005577 [Dryococelus australis]|uniref:Uncharacterized protein n=1 Tax=Dryococelus australis TaxID=614101 RepID=A0ABQ9I8R1_9NEOP|nr:hypothetical protein PR048_005577 [Dryococelus australis]